MGSASRVPARVERAFVGAYRAAAPRPLSAAVDFAGPSTTGAADSLAMAWTGPPAPAPLSAERSGCLLDGEIYNLEEIARIARIPAHQAPEATLASAYARLGEGLIARLRGEFALLLWDPRARTGLLARDQLGSGGLFIHAAAGGLLFASELRSLLGAVPRTPAPDRQALVHWLAAGAVPAEKTMYEGIVPLPPASLLRLDSEGWEVSRYWAPRYAEPHRLDAEDAAEELRSAVFGAVGRRLQGRSSVGVLVSGGLDSGSVLAVADRVAAPTEARFTPIPRSSRTTNRWMRAAWSGCRSSITGCRTRNCQLPVEAQFRPLSGTSTIGVFPYRCRVTSYGSPCYVRQLGTAPSACSTVSSVTSSSGPDCFSWPTESGAGVSAVRSSSPGPFPAWARHRAGGSR